MDAALEKVLAAAGPPLARDAPDRAQLPAGKSFDQIYEMLLSRNGYYALEGALLVRPLGRSHGAEFSIAEWNAEELWRREYGGLAGDLVFFAEDLFGGQFAVDGTQIVTFDPETGHTDAIADDIYEWAGAIVENYLELTAYPLARAWQEAHGPIPPGHRLMPVQPFSLGGEYHIDNLVARESAQSMRFRGSLARQMQGVRSGTDVRIRIDRGEGGESAPDHNDPGDEGASR
jgi:hypothetical protein